MLQRTIFRALLQAVSRHRKRLTPASVRLSHQAGGCVQFAIARSLTGVHLQFYGAPQISESSTLAFKLGCGTSQAGPVGTRMDVSLPLHATYLLLTQWCLDSHALPDNARFERDAGGQNMS